MFAALGAEVVDADKIVHQLYQPGEPVYDELVKCFGREILRPDGQIDRAQLAAAAFDGGRVQELNKIVHPAVGRKEQEWMHQVESRQPQAVAMVEATLILEAGARSRFDKIVVVTCRPEQKVARYAGRTGLPEHAAREEVERRARAQMPDEEKARRADYLIDNSGSIETTHMQVERTYAELKARARARS